MNNRLIVGDRVKDIKIHKGMIGTVSEIKYHDPTDPINYHGYITIQLDPEHVGKFDCTPDDEEHYTEFKWWECFEILEKVKNQ